MTATGPEVASLAARPLRAERVAAVEVDGHLVLAHERTTDPVVLGPIDAIFWASFDGVTALSELVDDVVAAAGTDRAEVEAHLVDLVDVLAPRNYLDGPRKTELATERRPRWPLTPDCCTGKRIGLGQATVVQVAVDGVASLRIGTTDGDADSLARTLPPWAELVEVDDARVDLLLLRATEGRGRRLQQLFGTVGQPLHTGRDRDLAHEALARSVHGHLQAGRSEAHGQVWLDAPIIVGPGGATLLNALTHRVLLGDKRAALEQAGLAFLPASVVRLDLEVSGGPTVTAAADLAHDRPERSWPLASVLLPERSSAPETLGVMAHLAHRWDQPHLEAIVRLAATVPHLSFDDETATPSGLAALLGAD